MPRTKTWTDVMVKDFMAEEKHEKAIENEVAVYRSIRLEEKRHGKKYLTKKGRDFLRQHGVLD